MFEAESTPCQTSVTLMQHNLGMRYQPTEGVAGDAADQHSGARYTPCDMHFQHAVWLSQLL